MRLVKKNKMEKLKKIGYVFYKNNFLKQNVIGANSYQLN